MTTDTVFNTDPMPSVMSRRWLDNQTLYGTPDPVVDAHLTWDAIQAAAKEAWIEGLCMNYDTRSDCVLHLHEVTMAFEASGRLDSAVALKAVCPGLMEVKAAWYGYILGWKDSKELDLTQGSASQNLAQTTLANINAYRLSPSDKLFQYSAHDTKVASLAVTFGDQGNTTMHPHYAAAIFVELLQYTANSDNWFVRLICGYPVKAKDDSYVFQQIDVQVNCIDEADNGYVATTGVCPLDNVRRLADYSRPAVANGSCVVTETPYKNMNCLKTYLLSAIDLQCYPSTDIPDSSSSNSNSSSSLYHESTFPKHVTWTPRLLPLEKGRRIATTIINGLADGLVIGTAIGKQSE